MSSTSTAPPPSSVGRVSDAAAPSNDGRVAAGAASPIAFPSSPDPSYNASPSSPRSPSLTWRSGSRSRKTSTSASPSAPMMLQDPIHLNHDRWNSPRRAPRPPQLSPSSFDVKKSRAEADSLAFSSRVVTNHIEQSRKSEDWLSGALNGGGAAQNGLAPPSIQPRDESIGCLGQQQQQQSEKSKGKARAIDPVPSSLDLHSSPRNGFTTPSLPHNRATSDASTSSMTPLPSPLPIPPLSPPRNRRRPMLPAAYNHQTPQALPGSPTFAALLAKERQHSPSPQTMTTFPSTSPSTSAAASGMLPTASSPLRNAKPDLPRPMIPAKQDEMGVIMAAGHHQRRRNRSAGDILDFQQQPGLSRRTSDRSASASNSRDSNFTNLSQQRARLNSLPLTTLESGFAVPTTSAAASPSETPTSFSPAPGLVSSRSADGDFFPRAMHRLPARPTLPSPPVAQPQRQLRSASSIASLRMAVPTGWAKSFWKRGPASPPTEVPGKDAASTSPPSVGRSGSWRGRSTPSTQVSASPFSAWRRQATATPAIGDDDEDDLTALGPSTSRDNTAVAASLDALRSMSALAPAEVTETLLPLDETAEAPPALKTVKSKRSIKNLREKMANLASPNKAPPPPIPAPAPFMSQEEPHATTAGKNKLSTSPRKAVPARIATDYGKTKQSKALPSPRKAMPSPQAPFFVTDLTGLPSSTDSASQGLARVAAAAAAVHAASSPATQNTTLSRDDDIGSQGPLTAPDRPWQLDTVISRGSPLFATTPIGDGGRPAGEATNTTTDSQTAGKSPSTVDDGLGPFAMTIGGESDSYASRGIEDELDIEEAEEAEGSEKAWSRSEARGSRNPYDSYHAPPSMSRQASSSNHAGAGGRFSGASGLGTVSACSEDLEAMASMDLGELLEGYRKKRDSGAFAELEHRMSYPHPFGHIGGPGKPRGGARPAGEEGESEEVAAASHRRPDKLAVSSRRPTSSKRTSAASARPKSKATSVASSYGTSFEGDVVWDGASPAMSTLPELLAADGEEEADLDESAALPASQVTPRASAPADRTVPLHPEAAGLPTTALPMPPLSKRRAGGHTFRFPRPPELTLAPSAPKAAESAVTTAVSAQEASPTLRSSKRISPLRYREAGAGTNADAQQDQHDESTPATSPASRGHRHNGSTPSFSSSMSASTAITTASHAPSSSRHSGSAGSNSAQASSAATTPASPTKTGVTPPMPSASHSHSHVRYGSSPSWVTSPSSTDNSLEFSAPATTPVTPSSASGSTIVTPPMPSSSTFASYHHQQNQQQVSPRSANSHRTRSESEASYRSRSRSSSVASSSATGMTGYSDRFVHALAVAHAVRQQREREQLGQGQGLGLGVGGKVGQGQQQQQDDDAFGFALSPREGEEQQSGDVLQGEEGSTSAPTSSSQMRAGHRRLKSSIDLLEKAAMATIGEH